ncbi:DUF262 domain-containing protein [soil metagenome]
MRPFTRTIIELFDSKRRCLIPLYQRQYAWKVEPQLRLLWADIERVADILERQGGVSAPHFMGAIVIAQVKTFGRQVQAYEVIDGQQRLTTFQLLLAAFRDVATSGSPEYGREVEQALLSDGVMEAPDVERYKLWPSLADRAAFTRLVDPAGLGAPAPHVLAQEEGVVRPSVQAHAFFVEAIRRRIAPGGVYDQFRTEKLFEALKDGLAVVSIELEGGDDPQTIFETLNSRGVELSAGDLMRNFIFQRAVGLGQENGSLLQDRLYQTYWQPLDAWFWREGETRGRLTRPRLDWMLVDHLAMKKAELVSADALFDAYRSWIIDGETAPYPDVEAELRDIARSAAIYRAVSEQKAGSPLGEFGVFAKAYDVSTSMPLVLYLASEADLGDDLAPGLRMIESYIIRRDICGHTTNNYNRFFVDIIKPLRRQAQVDVEALAQALSAGKIDLSRWPNDEEWRRQWMARAQYKPTRQPRLRYLFERLEADKRSAADEVVEIRSHLTLEHIMPQKWREHWPIAETPGLDPDEFDLDQATKEVARDGAVNLLGNITLLTQTLNSSVSNGGFGAKMPALKAQSALCLNRDLHAFEAWNEDAIAVMGAGLFEIARKRWKGPRPPVEPTVG